MKFLKTASLGSNFTGSYIKKSVISPPTFYPERKNLFLEKLLT